MKLNRLILMSAMLFALMGNALAESTKTYTFGVVPQFEPRKLSAIWTPILTELEKRTGFKLEMVGSARIPEFENEFENGKYDFAYMNPFHSLMAEKSQHYIPLVRDGGRKLFGILVTAKDGPIQKVEDLSGKTIAFPSPNALGASLMMRADLDQVFHLKYQTLWAQTHTSAYLNAALGKVAAAGGVMSTFNQQPKAVQNRLRIIYETRKSEPHPIVAHPRVPEADRLKMQKALLDLGNTPEGEKLLAAIPIKKIVPATAADYKELKDWGLEKYYVKDGN